MKPASVVALAALMVSSSAWAHATQWETRQAETPETKDRLSPESMDELVKGPMAVLTRSGLPQAQKAFDTLVADALKRHGKSSIEEADLLISFSVALYRNADDDLNIRRAALAYMERAVAAYRVALGPRHPEVAVALNSYADLALGTGDKTLRPAAKAALEEALSIRTEKLGPDNAETRANSTQLENFDNPQAGAMDEMLTAMGEALTTTETTTAKDTSGKSFRRNEPSDLWKPITYYDPLIDDFLNDMAGPDSAFPAGRRAIASKYGLSLAALTEGVALLRDMEKYAYDDRRNGALRSRALTWFSKTNRAPIALSFTAAILDQLSESSGCRAADFELLMKGSRDRDADLWTVATSCPSSTALAAAIAGSLKARPALIYVARTWTRGESPDELAAVDMLLERAFLAQVGLEQRDRVHAEIAAAKLMRLLDLGLLDEALAFSDSLNPAILAMALKSAKGDARTTIGGYATRISFGGNAPAEDYAAALALAGRKSDARAVLDLVAPLPKLKEARACLEAAKPECAVGIGRDISSAALIVDQLLDDPGGDPYVLMEAASRESSVRTEAIAQALCRLLTRPEEAKDCEIARRSADSHREQGILEKDDRALWEAIRQAGGLAFEKARSRYAAMLPPLPIDRTATDWSRTSVDPAPVPFEEHPIAPKLLAKSRRPGDPVFAALPKGFQLIRRERSGKNAVAVSLSTRFDPNGEVSAGGYWVHVSDDGGKSWGPPLYTGLAEHFPYLVPAESHLPMIAGDRIHLEVQESLIDTASISYPPVGLHIRRKRSGIYLDIPIAELRKDSDGDGLTDIAARHLLLDANGSASTPFVVGRDRDCSTPSAQTLARLEILKKLFEVEARALIEPPDKSVIIGDWRRIEPSGQPPIFLRGDPADWRCVVLDRPMIVYSDADRDRLRKFSPDFQLIELPAIRWNRAHTRGFVNWSMGWTGGTYRLTRNGEGWDLQSISEWIT